MEAKQHALEQLRREVKTCFKTNENGNIEQPIYNDKCLHKGKRKVLNKQPTLHFKKLEKT